MHQNLVPLFTKTVENGIKLWLQNKVMNVVNTKGGCLCTIIYDSKSKISPRDSTNLISSNCGPFTFDGFIKESLKQIKHHFLQNTNPVKRDDDGVQLIWKIMPMYYSDKYDGGVASELYYDLKFIVFSETPGYDPLEEDYDSDMTEEEPEDD